MAKLTIDMDEMTQAAETFQTLHDDFQAAHEQLDKAINNLHDSGWLSGASAAYFQHYEETWKENMKKHILILGHLKDCLAYAKSEYGPVVDALSGVENAI